MNIAHKVRTMDWLKRTVSTVARKRQSLGFGVHSPFVYALLVDVFRERMPYYAYARLAALPACSSLSGYSERINRLLFRLVNRFSPQRIMEVGTGNGLSALYMAAARTDAEVFTITDGGDMPAVLCSARPSMHCVQNVLTPDIWKELNDGRTIDILHIAHTPHYKDAYEMAIPHTGSHTIYIIEGIHKEARRESWWKEVEADARNSITIDLYDVGLVFFDKKRTKRNYKMTF